MDIYLNPDTGQQNINCDLKLSGFNHMVIRTRSPMRYFRFALNLKSIGPDLIVQKETDSEELAGVLQDAMSKLKEKLDNPTRLMRNIIANGSNLDSRRSSVRTHSNDRAVNE
ncbi:MAG: hypothetical protein K8S27_12550, partial [Candidatus Omnitrophica bacterium]|nr:hypothetical protein [Candidatus Omnitrophota bacterium]